MFFTVELALARKAKGRFRCAFDRTIEFYPSQKIYCPDGLNTLIVLRKQLFMYVHSNKLHVHRPTAASLGLVPELPNACFVFGSSKCRALGIFGLPKLELRVQKNVYFKTGHRLLLANY